MNDTTANPLSIGSPVSRLAPLPTGAKLAVTLLLLTWGLGYLAALGSLYLGLQDADGKPGFSIDDALIHFRGQGGQSRFEIKLQGSMFKHLGEDPTEQKQNFDIVHAWLTAADRNNASFQKDVWPIIEVNCMACHARDPADTEWGRPDAPMENVDDVMVFVNQVDTGVSYRYLSKMSHSHLFGIGGLIAGFSLILWCTGVSLKMKMWVSCTGFVATIGDVGSWWLTKYADIFAYLSGAFGMVLGLCFAVFIFVPLYDMWIVGRQKVQEE